MNAPVPRIAADHCAAVSPACGPAPAAEAAMTVLPALPQVPLLPLVPTLVQPLAQPLTQPLVLPPVLRKAPVLPLLPRILMAAAVLACLLAGLLASSAAHAGASCEDRPLEPRNVAQAMDLALRTRDALDASGAQVALVARAGQDLSAYGLRYSHMAFVWRDHPQGRWLVVHELNGCGTASSGLYNEGLGNFFLDDMFLYEAQIVIPSPAMQQRLARVLATSTPRRLHQPQYNMLSYAFSTRYQNSNQWVLETVAAAGAAPGQVENRGEAQAWLKSAGFTPLPVHIPTLTRLGARMFRANVAFDDHPFDQRMAGRIDTVTVDAVVRFMRRTDAGATLFVVR